MDTSRVRIASKLAPAVEVWRCFYQGVAGTRFFVGASLLAIMSTRGADRQQAGSYGRGMAMFLTRRRRHAFFFVGASLLAIINTARVRIASKLAPTVEVRHRFEQGFASKRALFL